MNTIVALASVSALKTMLEQSVFLGVFLSLGSYGLGMWLKRKTGWALMNQLLIAVVLVVAFLAISGVSYTSYNNGARILDYLLTPATIG